MNLTCAGEIKGVEVRNLDMHGDERGCFTELYRYEWAGLPRPVQWNMVRSRQNVLRGVHVHLCHWDYLIIAGGSALVGLCDLRADSPTFRDSLMLSFGGKNLGGLVIPPGVAHGFYFQEESVHIYAVTHYWDMADELGCRWDDPELGMNWPCAQPLISTRDEILGSLKSLLSQMESRNLSLSEAA